MRPPPKSSSPHKELPRTLINTNTFNLNTRNHGSNNTHNYPNPLSSRKSPLPHILPLPPPQKLHRLPN
jgi:hypothetical protein